MKQIVIEIQKNINGEIGLLTNDFDSNNEAISKFHLVSSAAAISELPRHTAVMISETGLLMRRECYGYENDSDNYKYIVIEIQKNEDGTIGLIANTYDNKEDALSHYYYTLSFAVKSQLPMHGCIVLLDNGEAYRGEHFTHDDIIEDETNE